MLSEGTIIALATPEGSGAIGLIRLSGPDAFEITKVFFRPKSKKPLDEISVKTSILGNFTVDEEIIDEVASTRITERGGRADDKRSEAAMEDRKKEGYF